MMLLMKRIACPCAFALCALFAGSAGGATSKPDSGAAETLRVSAETGNPLHIVREGCGEKPVLRIENTARERIVAHGVLKMEGFRGNPIEIPVDVALEGGETIDIPLPGGLPKGVWRIQGELSADDGNVTKVETRFAVMDYHERTPKQPMGTFRLGVLWHIQRFSKEDRRIAAEAMAACGAKLTRADIANMWSIQRGGPDAWDFAQTDEFLETLEEYGIALDAIIFNIPKWAVVPEKQTNTNWRIWGFSRPVPGTFGRFCEGLAARYGTRIDYYEIGNEWDLGFPDSVDDAVEVQREAWEGLKRGCPDVCVLPNGWAVPGDHQNVVKSGHAGFHEAFLNKARDWFDVHPIHCHGSFARYAREIREEFFPLRKRAGVSNKPWFSNETALTSIWSERDTARTVWKKILWAWANGSVDYIWYNLRATGREPGDSEQGYGLITETFRPRETYVAFAALATVVGGGEFRRTVFDDGDKYCFEFSKGGNTVLAAWNQSGAELSLHVVTDASRAWLVDFMGNRTPLTLENGQVVFDFGADPCALVLEGATFAKPDAGALLSLPADDSGTIVIPPDSLGRAPDFVLDKPEQVHDFFEADPSQVSRLWAGPQDNSAKVWLAREESGLRIRVEVRDDVHSQPFEGSDQYLGDDVQVTLDWQGLSGPFEFGFARRDDGRGAVHCWLSPVGIDAAEAAAWVKLATARQDDVTRYDALIPYADDIGFTRERLSSGIRFDLMVNDNDGDGRDATLEITPGSFHAKDPTRASRICFAP